MQAVTIKRPTKHYLNHEVGYFLQYTITYKKLLLTSVAISINLMTFLHGIQRSANKYNKLMLLIDKFQGSW